MTRNRPINVDFDDGAVLTIKLSNALFVGGGGTTIQTVHSDATVELTKDATVVPEPGSLALLGTGLLGLAFVRRRRRS
ncbi:MAG: PEP-CTERM sorting domain-containing protein [Acetobacteraceae bacterium]